MEKIIHVHEVLNLLKAENTKINKQELKQLIENKIGKIDHFVTCMPNTKYTFDEILEFMESKNKISINGDSIEFNNCNSGC